MKTQAKRFKRFNELSKGLQISEEVSVIAEIKAKLTKNIIKSINEQGLTHEQVAKFSGVPRSAVTGIINGSLQKVQ